jgi:hypothetical protein
VLNVEAFNVKSISPLAICQYVIITRNRIEISHIGKNVSLNLEAVRKAFQK